MKSMHNRKYVSGITALVIERIIHNWILPQDSIEKLIIDSHFLEKAPFLWISLSYRYGIKNDLKVLFQGIDKKYGDLDIALELDTDILEWADSHNLGLMHDIYLIAALEALIQVGKKYKLPTEIFESERAKYGNIPTTIEECKKYPQITTKELRQKLDAADRDRLIINRCPSCKAIKKTPKARQCLECGLFADPILE